MRGYVEGASAPLTSAVALTKLLAEHEEMANTLIVRLSSATDALRGPSPEAAEDDAPPVPVGGMLGEWLERASRHRIQLRMIEARVAALEDVLGGSPAAPALKQAHGF